MTFSHVVRSAFAFAILSVSGGVLSAKNDDGADRRPWGVYAWGGDTREALSKADDIRGVPIGWHWSSLEPSQGRFAFAKEVRAPLEALAKRGLYTHIMLWVAPKTPDWVYEAGVPRVEMPERITPARKKQKPTYPYYFDPRYKQILHHTVQALGDYIATLPPALKSRILFIQVAEGSTGDGQPYKGIPLDSRYRIGADDWNAYRRETWAFYQSVFQRADGSLSVPILVNGDANGPDEDAWLLAHCDRFGVKQGMFSHGYLVSDSISRLAEWEQYRGEVRSRGKFVFSRGEEDEEWKVCGWCNQNPRRALYWTALFGLHCKLDIWNVPTDAIATGTIGEALAVFNRYAGYDEPAASPVAFCALRRGLNAADTTAFPEAKFGPAQKGNVDRYLAIAAAYAAFGARQEDPSKATGGGMRNRQADGQNDVGWNIIPGNFERFLEQIDPEATSVALWNAGPEKSPYGLFARRFDAASDKKTMRFRVAGGFFTKPDEPHAVRVRVVYLDKGQGSWSLVYATAAGEKSAQTVRLTDSGAWRDLVVDLPDAVWGGGLAGGGDLALKYGDGDDTVFHLIELTRQ